MRGRILFVAGIAAGYIIGARAGRSAYDSVVERAKGITGSSTVQQAGAKAKQTLEEKAPKVADAAQKAAATVGSAASAAEDAGAASDEQRSSDGAPKPTPPAAPQAPAGSAA